MAKRIAVGVCGSSPAFLFARVFATTPLAWLLCPRAFGLRRSGGGPCFTSPGAIVVVEPTTVVRKRGRPDLDRAQDLSRGVVLCTTRR